MTEVRLVDLDVIKRYSLAVRVDTVDAGEVLDALDASRAVVLAALAAGGEAPRGRTPARRPARRPAPAARAPRAAKGGSPEATITTTETDAGGR